MKCLPPSTTPLRFEKRFLLMKERYEGKTYTYTRERIYLLDTGAGEVKAVEVRIREFAIDGRGQLTVFVSRPFHDDLVHRIARDLLFFGYTFFVVRFRRDCIYVYKNGCTCAVFSNGLPYVRRSAAMTLGADLVSAQPMAAPQGHLYYLDPRPSSGIHPNLTATFQRRNRQAVALGEEVHRRYAEMLMNLFDDIYQDGIDIRTALGGDGQGP